VNPPAELTQLSISADNAKKASKSPSGPIASDVSTIDESMSEERPASTASDASTEADNVLKRVKANIVKQHMSGLEGSVVANKRLMREFKQILSADVVKKGHWTVELVDDKLFEWSVKIKKLDDDSELTQDLKTLQEKYGQDYIHLKLRFKDTYPFTFPVVGIVTPRMRDGHVFTAGAMCMELLTKDGWSSTYTAEKVILQVISTLCVGKARVHFDKETMTPYEQSDLEQAYARLAEFHKHHGWHTPQNEKG